MKLLWTEKVADYFSGEEKEQFIDNLYKKIPAYIENNYFRIKPVHSLEKTLYPFFELKIHVGYCDYRVAFYEKKTEIVICYISKTLQKKNFDKEMKKWYRQNFGIECEEYIRKDDSIV